MSFGAGPYTLSNAEIDGYAVYTDNVPAGAMRGFGNPPVTFASEVQLNRLAEKLNLDPIDIRLKNILEEGLPTITGERIRFSVGVKACLLAVKEALSGTTMAQIAPGSGLALFKNNSSIRGFQTRSLGGNDYGIQADLCYRECGLLYGLCSEGEDQRLSRCPV